jgi:hypothetical protein
VNLERVCWELIYLLAFLHTSQSIGTESGSYKVGFEIIIAMPKWSASRECFFIGLLFNLEDGGNQ